MLCDPSGARGVPTQTIASSQEATPASGAVTACNRSLSSASRIISSRPGSVIGDLPERTVAIFGAGHGTLLRSNAVQSGRFTLVDVLRYLPPVRTARC